MSNNNKKPKLGQSSFAALASDSEGGDASASDSHSEADEENDLVHISRQLPAKSGKPNNKKRKAKNVPAPKASSMVPPQPPGRSLTASIASVVGATSLLHCPADDFVRVKQAHLARLLYTNPVCLLTSSVQNLKLGGTPLPAQLLARGALRNVMTVSWLSPTSNRGEFVLSMHAARYSARLVHAPGHRFTLSVPVRGMESLVKQIGSRSGSGIVGGIQKGTNLDDPEPTTTVETTETTDAEPSEPAASTPAAHVDKIADLAIPLCRPGAKSQLSARQVAAFNGPLDLSAMELDSGDALDDHDDALHDLFAVRGCCAHLVCTVVRCLPAVADDPAVVAHNVLFCRVQRYAFVV
jgi:flavin reductase (DIM6/NTAB) family NADH-FMN oxidoreductase RutF